ncbi:hypothetical protein [Lebetimonas sp. JS085]|uniref:hypothetical protein n=1 Tax=Lebetimonas sp. JS085 TaxID=931222 RepID=UPI000463FE05|nr:hypothetical protein [Lebetimonas sp. JS085]
MIKEIIDIGRVSNRLGSVFTFKGLPEYYVEIILEWNGKDFKYNDEKAKLDIYLKIKIMINWEMNYI